MIKLVDISKTYRSKKGGNTRALNNLTLDFEEKGMTFIIGKSGSGKSTLLNILGGLDKYDHGDMQVLGKSTKKFSQLDYDSYRNTYVGFVFQEYNILEDYTVYENIVLALQLQQKKVNENEVAGLIETLELGEVSNRKINELSGGQKQRVAIARALIKRPRIILADEPTGNLDSHTGKQVMDLLKIISNDRLVIVVSHDNEAAQKYADRIIEIKDGNVIGDSKAYNGETENKSRFALIKSKLPFKESLKLGFGSLRHKKIKLFFTIMLTAVTLLSIGLGYGFMTYDINDAHSKLLVENNTQFLQTINLKTIDEEDNYRIQVPMKEDELSGLRASITQKSTPYYSLNGEYSALNITDLIKLNPTNLNNYEKQIVYYDAFNTLMNELVIISDPSQFINESIIGEIPDADNEILISKYVADLIIYNGVQLPKVDPNQLVSDAYRPNSYDDIINDQQELFFGDLNRVVISGIIDHDTSEFDSLKDITYEQFNADAQLINTKLNLVSRSIYNKIYVTDSFMDTVEFDAIGAVNNNHRYTIENEKLNIVDHSGVSVVSNEIEYFNGTSFETISSLGKNEVIIDIRNLGDFNYEEYDTLLQDYYERNEVGSRRELEKEFFANYVQGFDAIGEIGNVSVNEYYYSNYNDDLKDLGEVEIVGLIGMQEAKLHGNYFSKDLLEEYSIEPISLNGLVIYENTYDGFSELLDTHDGSETYRANSAYTNDIEMLGIAVDTLKIVAFYVSLVLVIFAISLISNFMFTSVSYRKKEIGVLRALGASTFDVVKIFLWEGIIIALIAGTLSSILLVFSSMALNSVARSIRLLVSPFILNFSQIIVIYLLVILVVFIASILPIRRISRMKPIDAILKK